MITDQIRKIVWERANGRCEDATCLRPVKYDSKEWEVHHIYWKSEIKGDDRDEVWNLACLCVAHHREDYIHSVHGCNWFLNTYLKGLADKRKPKEERSKNVAKEILTQRIKRKSEYKNKIEKFKKSHNGLSPFQVEYRRQKSLRMKEK